jgi:hypothetical protein
MGKPEGKDPLDRPKRRWVDNIVLYLVELALNGRSWIDPQDTGHWTALMNKVMNFQFPKRTVSYLVAAQTATSQERLSLFKLVMLPNHY